MTLFIYDSSFEGLLTALFDAYSRKEFPERLVCRDEPPPLFTDSLHEVVTDQAKAGRVWKAFRSHLPHRVCNMIRHVWLSEIAGIDERLMRYMRHIVDSGYRSYDDFTDRETIELRRIATEVAHEGERLRQFIRFSKAADGSYFAPVAPKYNALLLAVEYLCDRFADQTWLVYDISRRYGYYYDQGQASEVTLEDDTHLLHGLPEGMKDTAEDSFEAMWREYLTSLTIKERLNPRLQRKNMPQRFWRFMPDKQ